MNTVCSQPYDQWRPVRRRQKGAVCLDHLAVIHHHSVSNILCNPLGLVAALETSLHRPGLNLADIRPLNRSLLFLSGIPTAAKPTAKKYYMNSHKLENGHVQVTDDSWDKYKHFLSRTSVLFPIPPALYKPLPQWLKQTVLLDLPMYRFKEEEGRKALEEKQKQSREEA